MIIFIHSYLTIKTLPIYHSSPPHTHIRFWHARSPASCDCSFFQYSLLIHTVKLRNVSLLSHMTLLKLQLFIQKSKIGIFVKVRCLANIADKTVVSKTQLYQWEDFFKPIFQWQINFWISDENMDSITKVNLFWVFWHCVLQRWEKRTNIKQKTKLREWVQA